MRTAGLFDWTRVDTPDGGDRWEFGEWSITCRERVQQRAGRRVASAFLFDVWLRKLDLVAVRMSLDAAMAFAQRRMGAAPTSTEHLVPRTPQRAQQLAIDEWNRRGHAIDMFSEDRRRR